MSDDPANLRLFASIFLKKRRYFIGGILYDPSQIERAAAQALIERAERLEGQVCMSTVNKGVSDARKA